MKKITFILILNILLYGCKATKVLDTKQLNVEELERWMINNSKGIKDITRTSFFKISNPKDYNREKLIQNIADSLKLTAIQKLSINDDKYEDLLVYGTKIPYLIINGKQPKILSLRRDYNKEVLAYSDSKGRIRIYEIDHGAWGKSIRQYDLVLWNNTLIEPTETPNFKIKKIKYQASGYGHRLYNIDMNGEILFFSYSRNEDKSEKVWLKKGKIPKRQLKVLNNFFSALQVLFEQRYYHISKKL